KTTCSTAAGCASSGANSPPCWGCKTSGTLSVAGELLIQVIEAGFRRSRPALVELETARTRGLACRAVPCAAAAFVLPQADPRRPGTVGPQQGGGHSLHHPSNPVPQCVDRAGVQSAWREQNSCRELSPNRVHCACDVLHLTRSGRVNA